MRKPKRFSYIETVPKAVALVNPVGPESGTERVIRGGSYYLKDPTYCRVSCRMGADPVPENYSENYPIGLRLVLDEVGR